MAVEIKAPGDFQQYLTPDKVVLFAGGSIEMNTAKGWQKRLVAQFRDDADVVILNPRRDNWDASWKQTKANKEFSRQVNWELDALEMANVIFMYFDPATKSPISLLETGLFAFDYGCREPKLHVVCPAGFWRKGNVDITCERYAIPQFPTIGAAVKHIKNNKERFKYIR